MPVEKVPAFAIEDKFVDALISKPSNFVFIELSLLTIICRYNDVPPMETLIKMLGFDKVQLEKALYRLIEIGFLKKCEYTISN